MERTTPKRKVNKEPKSTRAIKRPRVITSIKDVKPIKLGSNDKRKRYLNRKTGDVVLWKSFLASKCKEMSALSVIKQKGDEEWQQKLKTFKEISQKIKKKINDQKLFQQSWFSLRKALKNYTKSFGIKITDKNYPLIQPNSTIDSVASLLKKQLNEMKGIKHIETLKLTFKKTTIDADKNEPKMIFKTAYFNCWLVSYCHSISLTLLNSDPVE